MSRLRHAAFLVFLSALASGLPAGAEDRIVRPVDLSRTAILSRHAPQKAQRQDDLGAAPLSTALRYATLRLKPAEALESFLAEQRNPGSPNYHRWLTPEQFADRFGLSSSDITKLVTWLQSAGLQVHDVARGRAWITFSGNADDVNRAFHTEIRRYRVNGEVHFANSTDLSIPSAFEDVVSGIEGLDDFGLQPLVQLEKPAPQFTSGSARYLAPDDFATIYNVTPLYKSGFDGSGQKIAVVGQSAIDVADFRRFRQAFNLAPNDPQVILYGPDPGVTSGLVESNLDIEWAGAVARQATILYVYSNNVETATQYAVDQNLAPLITFSYGECEAYSSAGLRAVAQQANAQGITWLAASGDSGAANCDITSPTPQASKGPSASFPASVPEITAVGGTEFDDGSGAAYWAPSNIANGASALAYVPERAWNDSALRNDLAAAGGGPSILFGKPAWQVGPGVPNDSARDTPDLALAASPQHYAYIMYSGGALIHVGGTSASSPAFAGMLALLNQYLVSNASQVQPGLGNINPALYRLAQATTDVFHDITVGDNRIPCSQGSPECTGAGMGYAARPGYDLATGLGSVDAYHLVMEWQSGTSTSTTLTASPALVSLTDTVQLIAAVSSGGGAPTGNVTFLANDTTVGTALLTPAGAAGITVPSASLVAGNGTVIALYSGDGVFNGSAGTATVSLDLRASGSLVVPFVSPNPVLQAGSFWPYTVGLSEKAGVGTTVTGFTIDGVRQNLGFWTNTSVPPQGTVFANLAASGLAAPVNRVFAFSGQDADGRTWSQQITVPFAASAGPTVAPSVSVHSAPATVRQNPQADSACQYAHELTIQEAGGFLVRLVSLRAGSTDFSNQIQQLFGTTRLAPYGMLQGKLCWDNNTTAGTKSYQLLGISEVGTGITAGVSVTFAAAAPAPPHLSVSPAAVPLGWDGTDSSSTASVAVSFDSSAPAWTATVLPANRTTSWLTTSTSAPGQLVIHASGDGLANGLYRAIVSIEAPDAIPAAISVPVTMVVGAAPAMTIFGVRNNASGTIAFAPGMQVAVYGSQLSSTSQSTSHIPVPLKLAGVSATVNGVSAPVYSVSPGQIDLQIPFETGLGTAALAINNNGQVASFPFPVAVAAPGIYNLLIDDTNGARNTARPGDVITMFITGAGDLSPSLATGATPSSLVPVQSLPQPRLSVGVTVGGEQASIAFAGNASGLVGVTQINFTVPADLAPGDQPVVVTVGGIASDPVNLVVSP